jgi:plasmid stabilization system protein ParE
MHYKVSISRRAENNLGVLYEYLIDNWPDKVRIDFIKSLKKEVDYLRVNPYINQKSDL